MSFYTWNGLAFYGVLFWVIRVKTETASASGRVLLQLGIV